MAKRFTDSEKWKKMWFQQLPVKWKLFWLYLLDNCDHAGIWDANWPLVNFYFDGAISPDEAEKTMAKQIKVLANGTKWFIADFVDFQYGHLNKSNNAHKSVIQIHEKLGLIKPLRSPLLGALDTDTDTDKRKGQKKFRKPTLEEVSTYCRERSNNINPQKWLDHYESNGWKVGKNAMKDWKAAVRTWEGSEFNKAKNQPHRPKMVKL